MSSITHRITSRFLKTAKWIHGWFYAWFMLSIHRYFHIPIGNLNEFERRIPIIENGEYSQNGEDGIIHAIFAMIGTTNKFCVEFGATNGRTMSNTLYLREQKGWTGLLMEGNTQPENSDVQQEFVTAENVEDLFAKYNVPEEFDLLSIDIDGNDYWIWKAIKNYKPRVIVIEYNASFPWEESKTIAYNPTFRWNKTDYMGATLQALVKLGKEKGYKLIATDSCGVNAFFVQKNLINGKFNVSLEEKLYHPAAYKGKTGNKHPADTSNRPWVYI